MYPTCRPFFHCLYVKTGVDATTTVVLIGSSNFKPSQVWKSANDTAEESSEA
jgi:hypothetical protein